MKARLIKKEDVKPVAPRRRKRVARRPKLGNVIVNPRAAFEALFANSATGQGVKD